MLTSEPFIDSDDEIEELFEGDEDADADADADADDEPQGDEATEDGEEVCVQFFYSSAYVVQCRLTGVSH
jgi:hypothetical protein